MTGPATNPPGPPAADTGAGLLAAGPRDVRPPLALETPPPFLFTLGLLVLVALAWGLYRAWRRPRPGPTPGEPDRRARLVALADRARRGEGPDLDLVLELDQLWRAEWAACTGQPIQTLTSRELDDLAAPGLDVASRERLAALLAVLDRAKFAGLPLSPGEASQALALAERLWDTLFRPPGPHP